ncbi:hypothetical protein RI655_32695, partial [Pseudomonas aeruginosa]
VYRGDCYLLKLSSNYRRPYTMKIKNILLTLCTSLLLTNVAAHAKEVKIGMAIDDLRLERWQKDRDKVGS